MANRDSLTGHSVVESQIMENEDKGFLLLPEAANRWAGRFIESEDVGTSGLIRSIIRGAKMRIKAGTRTYKSGQQVPLSVLPDIPDWDFP